MHSSIDESSDRCQDSVAEEPLYHYVVVRDDLPKGMMGAQIVHAAGESVVGKVPSGTHAVVLAADLDQLLKLVQRLRAFDVRYAAIVENEGPHTGELLAIGIRPGRKSDMRRHVSALPLLK